MNYHFAITTNYKSGKVPLAQKCENLEGFKDLAKKERELEKFRGVTTTWVRLLSYSYFILVRSS